MQITSTGTHVLTTNWTGGDGRITVAGTFATDTVATLAFRIGNDYIAFGDDSTFSEGGGARFTAKKGDEIAFVVTGSAGLSLRTSIEAL